MSDFQNLRKAFFRFDRMITPSLVQSFFIVIMVLLGIAAAISLLSGLLGLFAGETLKALIELFLILPGILLSAVLIRVFCEAMLVLFKLNENMQKVADATTVAAEDGTPT